MLNYSGYFVLHVVLAGCMVVGSEEGVHIIMGPDGRETGEAFVELMSSEDVKQALAKNKCHIGRRYIDGNLLVSVLSSEQFYSSVFCSYEPGDLEFTARQFS